eukprot:1930847-Amphidinium_carterae.1
MASNVNPSCQTMLRKHHIIDSQPHLLKISSCCDGGKGHDDAMGGPLFFNCRSEIAERATQACGASTCKGTNQDFR